MTPTTRSWLPGRKALAALAGGLLVVLLALAFDWNWLRGPLEGYLSERSRRTVRLAHLDVSFADPLHPTVHLRGVHIDNAPWAASPRPMAQVAQASFNFSLPSALKSHWIISRLVLDNADVDLEIAADGRRNWRLREPDARGRGRLRVLDLEARNSRIRFVHGGIGLEVQFDATPLPAPVPGALPADPLVTGIDFHGRYEGRAFAGRAETSRSITFRETDRFFALKGWFKSGKTRLEADGVASDVLHGSALRGKLGAKGPSLALLRPFVHAPLPASRAYAIDAELTKEKTEYAFARVRAEIGETDIRGEVTYEPRQPRPLLSAKLHSKVGHLSDLASLAGFENAAGEKSAPATTARPGADRPPRQEARLFSPHPWRAERLRGFDTQLDFRVERLVSPRLPALRSLAFSGRLIDGALELDPVELGVGGGRLAGRLALDARQAPPAASADLALKGVRLEQLLPELPPEKRVAGVLDGELRLESRGDSFAALMDHAAGRLEARVRQGSVASWLEARMALDGGKILRAVVSGRDPIPIRCAALAFDFQEGRGRSRMLAIDTERMQLAGAGSIDLGRERIDLLLTPRVKQGGALALRKSIKVQGSLRDLDTEVVEHEAPPAASHCATAQAQASRPAEPEPADPQ